MTDDMKFIKAVETEKGETKFYFQPPQGQVGYYLPNETYDKLLRASASANVYNKFNLGTGTSVGWKSYENRPYAGAVQIPTNPHDQIKLARDITVLEPIVGTVIDIMSTLMATEFDLECSSKKVKAFFEEFNEQVGMRDLVHKIAREYYLSGNVPIYRELNKGIPISYTVINPLYTYVEGSLLFDTEVISIDITEELRNLEKQDDEISKELKKHIPSFVYKQLNKNKDKIIIPPEKISRITRGKQDYEKYATPYLARIFEPVLFKQKLRLMDLSTIEGLINQLLVVTVGSDKMPATQKQLDTIAELFSTPNKAFTLIWPNNVKVEMVPPEGLDTLNQDKYQQMNEDISLGLGVPRVIIDGTGTNYSTAFVAVTALLERIDRERAPIKYWIENQYKEIARQMGFKTYPAVRFDKSRLRQETYIRQVLNPLYEKGLLSNETVIDESGFEYEDELEKKKRNWKDKEYFMPPNLPYTNNPGGAEPGQPHDYDKDDDVSDEPRNGPDDNREQEPRQQASSEVKVDGFVEDFYQLFDEQYEKLRQDAKEIAEDESLTATEKSKQLGLLFEAFLITAYDETIPILEKVCKNSYNLYSSELDEVVFSNNLKYLQDWHRTSLDRLTKDLSDMSTKAIEQGKNIDEVFLNNHYRVGLFASESVLNSRRRGEVAAFESQNQEEVYWNGIIDENTCPICIERIGQTFTLANLPNRPHINCRCWLTTVQE